MHNRHTTAARVFALAWAATLVAGAHVAQADEGHRNKVYDAKGFEPQPFSAGSQLLGTDGWTTDIPPFLNPAAATITRDDSSNGRQSVEVRGVDLESNLITVPYDAVGSYRRPVNYTVSEQKPIVLLEADLLLETDQPETDDDFFSITIAARSGDGETLGEMGLSSSGSAVAYDFNAAPGAVALFEEAIQFNHWHRVGIAMDFESRTTWYFLDDVPIGIVDAPSTSNVLARGSMVVYALPDIGGDERANYTARFDNFRITVHRSK